MKKFNEFLTEGKVDIDAIRTKIGSPSYKEIEKEFRSGDKKFDPWTAVTYTFEVSIQFEGFEPTILEGKLIFGGENPTQSEIEGGIKDRLRVFNNIASYQVLSTVISDEQIRPMM